MDQNILVTLPSHLNTPKSPNEQFYNTKSKFIEPNFSTNNFYKKPFKCTKKNIITHQSSIP